MFGSDRLRGDLCGRGCFRAPGAGSKQRHVADRKQRPKRSGKRVAVGHRRIAPAGTTRFHRSSGLDRGDRADGGYRADRGPGPRWQGRAGGLPQGHQDDHQARKEAQDHRSALQDQAGLGRGRVHDRQRRSGPSVSRAGITYTTGLAIPTGTDRWQLMLTRHLRKLRPGRYTLTLRSRHGRHRILERRPITIT